MAENLKLIACSHHPPVTAYCIRNDKHGVTLQGYNAQKATFSSTIHVKQIGHGLLHLDAWNEDYLITLPNIHIEGLVFGKPFVELNKSTTITSSSGYTARIEYSGKGWVSGKKNSFTATLFPDGHEKETLYYIDGQWNESFTIRLGGKKGSIVDTYNANASHPTPLITRPVEEQDQLESKKAWGKTIEGIKAGNMDIVHAEKTKIEMAQREMRKQEVAEGREWQRRYFSKLEADPLFDKLAAGVGEKIESDRTGGIWRFDPAKAAKAGFMGQGGSGTGAPTTTASAPAAAPATAPTSAPGGLI
jgi:hypothetical protein